jgi:hypothetical protein
MESILRKSVLLAVLVLPWPAQGEKFRTDDPLQSDPDNITVPEPTERPLSKTIDLLQKTFTTPKVGQDDPQNVNTLGEVPNSSWFTNRMSQRVMSVDELVRGPNRGEGPDLSSPWTIVGAKTEGVTPGFRIQDGRGDVYFIKFDPLRWPQMATSTEVIGTKFFYAFGYNTPENYLTHWMPDYEVDPTAEVIWDSSQVTPLSRGYVEDVLEGVPRGPDGSIQVVASKLLPGRPIGPFDFQGVRKDDPNDIFPHQDRRELRGYSIFCAWLNHNDSDAVNTLDIYVNDGDEQDFVKHYLIDFGTTMGSGSTQPHARRVGNEYYIEFKPALKAAASLGIWDRPWRHVEYPDYTSIGRYESEYFQPEEWKPDYPNPAFDKMQLQDALWATRTVMRFSDEAIHAIVGTGQIEEPGAADYLASTLIKRRDKIVQHYLTQINPLDAFAVRTASDGKRSLSFANLGMDAGLAESCEYQYAWHQFDNQTEAATELNVSATAAHGVVPIPSNDSPFLMVRISSLCSGQPKWASPIDVYLRNGAEPIVVGLERQEPAE